MPFFERIYSELEDFCESSDGSVNVPFVCDCLQRLVENNAKQKPIPIPEDFLSDEKFAIWKRLKKKLRECCVLDDSLNINIDTIKTQWNRLLIEKEANGEDAKESDSQISNYLYSIPVISPDSGTNLDSTNGNQNIYIFSTNPDSLTNLDSVIDEDLVTIDSLKSKDSKTSPVTIPEPVTCPYSVTSHDLESSEQSVTISESVIGLDSMTSPCFVTFDTPPYTSHYTPTSTYFPSSNQSSSPNESPNSGYFTNASPRYFPSPSISSNSSPYPGYFTNASPSPKYFPSPSISSNSSPSQGYFTNSSPSPRYVSSPSPSPRYFPSPSPSPRYFPSPSKSLNSSPSPCRKQDQQETDEIIESFSVRVLTTENKDVGFFNYAKKLNGKFICQTDGCKMSANKGSKIKTEGVTRETLIGHAIKYHSISLDLKKKIGKLQEGFTCTKCSTSFTRPQTLVKHQEKCQNNYTIPQPEDTLLSDQPKPSHPVRWARVFQFVKKPE